MPFSSVDAPHLSGDDRTLTFSSVASGLVSQDTNGKRDVFTANNPLNPPARTAPTVTINAPYDGMLVAEGGPFASTSASANSAAGTIQLLTLELDGKQFARSSSGVLPATPFPTPPGRGVHTVRARAFDDDWVEGVSSTATLIVVPANGKVGITGATDLSRQDPGDGRAAFSANLRSDNRTGAATGGLRLILTAAKTPVVYNGQGDPGLVPDPHEEVVLQDTAVSSIAGFSSATVPIAGVTPPTEIIGDGFQGYAWTVFAALRLQSAPASNLEPLTPLLVSYPRLNENTELPNIGIPDGSGSGLGGPAATLQSITIGGPASVAERTAASFTATGHYSNGASARMNATWSLPGVASSTAKINGSTGVLTAGDVDASVNVTVKAVLGAFSATKDVTIKFVSPSIALTARLPNAAEPTASVTATIGRFKVTRTPGSKELVVNFSLAGKAMLNTDYTLTSALANVVQLPATPDGVGTITFPPNVASLLLDVTPLMDADVEGSESVLMTLQPGSSYRLGATRTRTVTIADAQAYPPDRPDLVLRRGGKPPVGAFIFDTDDDDITQAISARGSYKTPLKFSVSVINRGTNAQDFTVWGGRGANGFDLAYFLGADDITADVTAGTFVFTQLAPGSAGTFTLRITPTASAPLGASLETRIQATSSSNAVDLAKTFVERVR
jgi:hypothetical protein